MKKNVTLWRMPFTFIKFWWQFHMISKRICGRWNGVKVYTDGRVAILDGKLDQFVTRCMDKVGETE